MMLYHGTTEIIEHPDVSKPPTLSELSGSIGNKLFDRLCGELTGTYKATPKIEFSKCTWAYGWNIKFKKSGKNLCTVYPKEGFFTLLVVIGQKEKERAEALLPQMSASIQELYRQTEEGNGQRWLMMDLEDEDDSYRDALKLIELRFQTK